MLNPKSPQNSFYGTYLYDRIVPQDHLTGTAVMSDSGGAPVNSISYMPFGSTRSGSVPTDIQFTGQRLDDTGLYYYGARYYDPAIGRFISPDTVVQSYANPQSLNQYSYVLNSPLSFTDPYGWWTIGLGININWGFGTGGTFSFMFVVDQYGAVAAAVTTGSGTYYGAGVNIGVQFQTTSADSVTDLIGEAKVVGGSVTAGPTTPETFGTVNIGYSGGAETIIADYYYGTNVNYGYGASILPIETHGFTEDTSVEILWQPSNDAETSSYDADYSYYYESYEYYYDDYWYWDDYWW